MSELHNQKCVWQIDRTQRVAFRSYSEQCYLQQIWVTSTTNNNVFGKLAELKSCFLQPFRTLLSSVDVSDLHAPHDALGYPKRLLSSLNLWTLSRKKSSTWMPFKASHIVLKSEFFFLSRLPHEISSLFALLGHADGEVMLPKTSLAMWVWLFKGEGLL